MGAHVYKSGYRTIKEMMADVIADLIASGFVLKYPSNVSDLSNANGNYPFDLMRKASTKKRWCAILETAAAVNAKAADPWSIKFEWDINDTTDGIIDVIVGTPVQFNYTTGEHSYYTAKYMTSQKKVVVSGDIEKGDKAFDYKEVVGILGTSFRNGDVLITKPDLVARGIKTNVGFSETDDSVRFNSGDLDTIVNYKVVDSEEIQLVKDVSAANTFTENTRITQLLGTYGGTTTNFAQVALDQDLDFTKTIVVPQNGIVRYNNNFYRAAQKATTMDKLGISVLPIDSLISNGSPSVTGFGTASTSTVDGTAQRIKIGSSLYIKTQAAAVAGISDLASAASTSTTSPDGMIFNSSNSNKYYKTSTQILRFSIQFGYSVVLDPLQTYTKTTKIQFRDQNGSIISGDTREIFNDVIDLNGLDSTLSTQTSLLDYFKLRPVASNVTTTELSPTTASSLYGLTHVSTLNPVYIANAALDRTYLIKSAVSYTGNAPAVRSTFPTDTSSTELVHGQYNLVYVGKYSSVLLAQSLGTDLDYYDRYEKEDDEGYDTRLVDGDFSYPAIARNRNRNSKMFYNREFVSMEDTGTYPLSYTISATDRGFVLSVHEVTSDAYGNRNSWVVVQRPVDHVTGQVYTTGKAPVHCLYSIMARSVHKPWLPEDLIRGTVDVGQAVKIQTDQTGNVSDIAFIAQDTYSITIPAPEPVSVRRFIVRESDINSPYPTHVYINSAFGMNLDYATGGFPFGVPADRHTPDYNAVINTKQQVAISEGNKYVITFPNGFNTARYAYTHEMDMIAYTSADVISAGTEVEITAYGTTRKYVALQANGPNNTGMRILVLKQGGGIGTIP